MGLEKLMIIIDSSEAITHPPELNCHVVPWLEEMAGADMVISPADDVPCAEGMMPVHVHRGALLIQIKRAQDLVSSFGSRMNNAIAKMVQRAPKQWQRVLLPVGRYARGSDGLLLVGKDIPRDGDVPFVKWYKPRPSVQWTSYQTAIAEWIWRGGVVIETCKNQDDFWIWVANTEKKMKEAMQNPEKLSWPGNPQMYDPPDADDPLQEVKIIRDFRVTLATFPGIGEGRATDIWNYYKQNPLACLVGLTDLDNPNATQISGIGPSTIERTRKWFGLASWARVGVDINPDVKMKKLEDIEEVKSDEN